MPRGSAAPRQSQDVSPRAFGDALTARNLVASRLSALPTARAWIAMAGSFDLTVVPPPGDGIPSLRFHGEDALPAYAIDWLDKQEIRRIPVSYRDCVKLGGNLVSLGNHRVLSMAHNLNVNAQLKAEGFEVYAVEYEMFTLGGGGVHCSCHELHREPD